MLHWFYKAMVPRGWKDTAAKVASFTAVIVALNFLFSRIYFGAWLLPAGYLASSAICVGTPFVVLFFLLVRKQARLQIELSLKSRTDPMTNLPNRRWFMSQVRSALQQDMRGVLILLDADHFKRVNDTYGHQIGDKCLISIAHRLRRSLRTDDIVGRLGGEEFGVYLRDTTVQQARSIIMPMLQPIPYSGGPSFEHLTISVSLGAVQTHHGDDLDTLMRLADDALYAAKRNGRARIEVSTANDDRRPDPEMFRDRQSG
ncbi:GGDEF domain-containing protein [Loktanella sp. IMCC34160]|uniref:GGDEF domain-containing protein n=1 Tax=Loktanella sp. IMCC34160 TaxID=2510646 RepID=UPI00101B6177|nr:GGDEF domain-containing protein [Loktanella sp. IMCC34160]RYG89499.1 GGDEF domain-containing protein [Loktanella sp. IMCC34160]